MGIGIGPLELIILAACPLALVLIVVVALAIAGKRRQEANLINRPDCGNLRQRRFAACDGLPPLRPSDATLMRIAALITIPVKLSVDAAVDACNLPAVGVARRIRH